MREPTRQTKLTEFNWHVIELMHRCIMNDQGVPDAKRKRIIECTIKNFKMASVMKCWISNLNSAVMNKEITHEKLIQFWSQDAGGFVNNSEILQ